MTAVVITGAAGGIGAAVVRAVGRTGRPVVGVDRDGTDPGSADAWVTGDVRDPEVLDAAFAAADRLGGGAGGLVTCVFSDHRAPLDELDPEDLTAVVQDQLRPAWEWSRRLAASTPEPGRTAIVHVGSVHARLAQPGCAPYGVAKAGLAALTRAMAVEWGPRGIRCNCVEPGFVPVPRNAHRDPGGPAGHLPLRRVVSPDDVAGAVAFLLSDAAGGITGAQLPVDAGMSAAMPDWA